MAPTARCPQEAFRHEALLYAGADGFVDGAVPFIRDAVGAEEPILVMVGAAKLEMLRDALGDDARHVQMENMEEVGANPARIIPAWREFANAHADGGRWLRGIGEPIWAGRSAAELVECQRHESLINLAFGDAKLFWLVCPYDTEALPPEVIREAHCSHPVVIEGERGLASEGYRGEDAIAAPFDAPLPGPPAEAGELPFDASSLSSLRRVVAEYAHAAGISSPRSDDLVFAVNEIATNSVRHADGGGMLRVWEESGGLVCEVADGGRIDYPMVGRERPPSTQVGGQGLWLANQLCDLVQLRSFPTGNVVRVHMRRG
jgi:anti-sigma regulatory factor (Ser/Thr protein kinase)